MSLRKPSEITCGVEMKKLIRFQYEPCNGTCYTAPDDDFFKELENLDEEILFKTIKNIVHAHDRICDKINMGFGIDYCVENKIYVGTFSYEGKLDLFSSKSFIDCIFQLTNYILNKIKFNESYKCEYSTGKEENLFKELLYKVS